MSQSVAKETVLMRIEISMDSDTKTAFEDFKVKCCETLDKLSSITPQAKQADGGLLRAMAVEAANDGNELGNDQPEPELQALGQWVFEGQDENLQSATVDETGVGCLHACKVENLEQDLGEWYSDYPYLLLSGKFETINWQKSAISRQPVNDVDYLSDSIPHIDDVLNQPNCLSESIIPITETDLQSIFIKNLSTVLIQRMHSMDRFSEDDYAIGGNNLKAWDIVVDSDGLFGFAVCDLIHHESNLLNRARILRLRKFQDTTFTHNAIINGWRMDDLNWHTITEPQLPAFRAALEASYVRSQ